MKIKTNLVIIKGNFNVVPLIDVIFLLLIFFMLSSSFVQVSAIDITLPTVRAQTTNAEKLVVTISKNDKVYFNDQLMSLRRLKEDLAHIASKNQIDSIIIRADKDTPHGTVSEVLSLANSLNLNVYFAVASEKSYSQIPFEKNN
ncbi:MAG: biopolymer transporter ExbD [Victivallales bacterium]|nr:biopolymer transporter ExbD [Victivallales bacterium]MCF7888569.1 biopolymer transporter ExbD [Victivallales bacterium]